MKGGALVLAVAALALASATAARADPAGITTLQESVELRTEGSLRVPMAGPEWPRALRVAGPIAPQPGRLAARRSLAFFAHLTDAHVADEMSPARIDYLHALARFGGGCRPNEAFGAQTLDQAARNVNANATSLVRDGLGRRARLQFALVTGDFADNHQRNEVRWAFAHSTAGGWTRSPAGALGPEIAVRALRAASCGD